MAERNYVIPVTVEMSGVYHITADSLESAITKFYDMNKSTYPLDLRYDNFPPFIEYDKIVLMNSINPEEDDKLDKEVTHYRMYANLNSEE